MGSRRVPRRCAEEGATDRQHAEGSVVVSGLIPSKTSGGKQAGGAAIGGDDDETEEYNGESGAKPDEDAQTGMKWPAAGVCDAADAKRRRAGWGSLLVKVRKAEATRDSREGVVCRRGSGRRASMEGLGSIDESGTGV